MRLTSYTDYALRVLMYVAAYPGRLVSTREISEAYGVSLNHLVKVVNELGHHGYLSVKRGRGGGVALGMPAETIKLGDVARQFESGAKLVECFDAEKNTCPIAPACGLMGALGAAQGAFFDSLNRHTLADVTPPPIGTSNRDYRPHYLKQQASGVSAEE